MVGESGLACKKSCAKGSLLEQVEKETKEELADPGTPGKHSLKIENTGGDDMALSVHYHACMCFSDREISRDEFIFYSKRLMRLLIEFALSMLPFKVRCCFKLFYYFGHEKVSVS